ncbi:MAG: methylated-DNA--[protein]-cysteine S-methyltransferase [Deltaproteobacteria bacterium]|nr:methylated-DNA--[protein]-cysteine S-methyltransferase [Deltaproteobacteria bacterium]
MQRIYYTSFLTPIGRIYLAATEKGIYRVAWEYKNVEDFVKEIRSSSSRVGCAHRPVKDISHFTAIKNDIKRYFLGTPVSFKKYALDLKGTDFQKKVWRVLYNIPYGKLLTYQQVAEKIGKPNASRAVGSACGANDLPIIIPCHRVIASNGGLGGFSGGLKLKIHLLKLEGVKLSNLSYHQLSPK